MKLIFFMVNDRTLKIMIKKIKTKNILLVGGADYVGSSLMESYYENKLIKKINCLDWLIYKNQKKDSKIFKNKKYNFFYGDLRDRSILNKSLKNITDVIILAGLVGDPITRKYKKLSEEINYKGIKNLIDFLKIKKNVDKVIFISTCSNYGIVKGKKANEKTKLSPQSSYAVSKVKIEKHILKLKKTKICPTILRFSTAFGYAPRMRYDLTINEFCRIAHKEKSLVVYDPFTWRPYCHVKDFARILLKVLKSKNEKVKNEVFNVGSDKLNYQKIDIVKLIQKQKNFKTEYLEKKVDPRNYRVDFSKLRRVLKITPKYTAEYGIKEIIQKLKDKNLKINKKDHGNYIIKQYVK